MPSRGGRRHWVPWCPNTEPLGRHVRKPVVEQAEEEKTPNGLESRWSCTKHAYPNGGSARREENFQQLWRWMWTYKTCMSHGGSSRRGETTNGCESGRGRTEHVCSNGGSDERGGKKKPKGHESIREHTFLCRMGTPEVRRLWIEGHREASIKQRPPSLPCAFRTGSSTKREEKTTDRKLPIILYGQIFG